jgi:cell division protein ZapA (FtsZ GTPase activity inhibitor)
VLSLNGEVIKLDGMTVAMTMELKDQDMSGQSSATDTAEQGDKGKKLTFAGIIPFKSVAILTRLYQLASTKDDSDNRQVYRVGNDLARALKIRESKFTGSINATEHSTLLAWNVSFELREVNGVAEQKELRKNEQNKPQQVQSTRHQQALKDAEATGL